MQSKPDLISLLSHLPLLSGLDTSVLERIAAQARLREVARREVVLHKGSPPDGLYFLIKGRLQVVDHAIGGREVGLNFIAAGEFFGELSILDGLPRSASVIATEPSLLLIVPCSLAQELFYHQPIVAERLLRHFARKLRLASAYQSILSLPNAYQRVFALLDALAETPAGGTTVIERLPTQQEIAIMINTSRETVSRALHQLMTQGVVQKETHRIVVCKPEQLRRAAGGDV